MPSGINTLQLQKLSHDTKEPHKVGMGMTFMYLSKYSPPAFRLKELALAGSHSDYAILVAHLREKTKQLYFPKQTSVQQSFSEIHWSPLEIITQGHTVSSFYSERYITSWACFEAEDSVKACFPLACATHKGATNRQTFITLRLNYFLISQIPETSEPFKLSMEKHETVGS